MAAEETICPGCGLAMPASDRASYDGYYSTSPECWSVCTEVLGREFGNALLYGHAHQLTVDAYAVQHAGGRHPDKSIAVHLTGLLLVLERQVRPPRVPKLLQRLTESVTAWPHLAAPPGGGTLTVFDVALADGDAEHIERAEAWAREVWDAWSAHHDDITAFVERHLQASPA